jgi:hypothetical protein
MVIQNSIRKANYVGFVEHKRNFFAVLNGLIFGQRLEMVSIIMWSDKSFVIISSISSGLCKVVRLLPNNGVMLNELLNQASNNFFWFRILNQDFSKI